MKPHLLPAARRVRHLEAEPVDRREAALPEWVLQHDRNHVPAQLEHA